MAYLSTGTSFDIPLDVYSRSGLPKQHQENLLSSIMPQLIGATGNLTNLATNPNNSMIGRTLRAGKDVTTNTMGGMLSKLAGRGLMDSQTGKDAIKELGMGLNEQIYGQLAGKQYDLQTQLPGILANIAGLGQSTENPFQPYQSVLSLIQSMM